jgi:hypothetical protein
MNLPEVKLKIKNNLLQRLLSSYTPLELQFCLIRDCHEFFERQDVYLVGIDKMTLEPAVSVEIPERPALATEDQIGLGEFSLFCRVRQRDYFKRHLLLGGAGYLLPFERYQVSDLFRDHINEVPPPAGPWRNLLLRLKCIAAPLQCRQNHRLDK